MLVTGPEVATWVCKKAGGVPGPHMTAIGWLTEGELTAGAVFEHWTKNNIFAHCRIDGPAPKGFWFACMDYAFNQLRCSRLSAMVDSSNTRSTRLLSRLGFVLEALLDRAAADGGDRLIFVLWRDKCRMLDWR